MTKYGKLAVPNNLVSKYDGETKLGAEAYNYLKNDFKETEVVDITQYPDDIQDATKDSVANNSNELLGGDNAEFKAVGPNKLDNNASEKKSSYNFEKAKSNLTANTIFYGVGPLLTFLGDKAGAVVKTKVSSKLGSVVKWGIVTLGTGATKSLTKGGDLLEGMKALVKKGATLLPPISSFSKGEGKFFEWLKGISNKSGEKLGEKFSSKIFGKTSIFELRLKIDKTKGLKNKIKVFAKSGQVKQIIQSKPERYLKTKKTGGEYVKWTGGFSASQFLAGTAVDFVFSLGVNVVGDVAKGKSFKQALVDQAGKTALTSTWKTVGQTVGGIIGGALGHPTLGKTIGTIVGAELGTFASEVLFNNDPTACAVAAGATIVGATAGGVLATAAVAAGVCATVPGAGWLVGGAILAGAAIGTGVVALCANKEKIANAVKTGAKKVANAAKTGAKKVANAVKTGAKKVANAAKTGAKKVWKAITSW